MNSMIKLTDTELLGSVTYVDTAQVIVEIENPDFMSQISVGNLVAIETGKKHQLLISLIDKVRRKYIENFEDPHTAGSDMMTSSEDYIIVNIIGTYHIALGNRKNVFKKGIDMFPQIESKCYCISGVHLQNFMNLLSNSIQSDKQLKLGTFGMDMNAKAVLDGNKFFQRHAAILGSTGSGKSWCVANILEKASALRYTNIIVFDIHGEYGSLTRGKDKIAESYKIAGPGDLGKNEKNILFLPYWLLNTKEILSIMLDQSDANAAIQASRFTFHTHDLKGKTLNTENKHDTIKTFTVDSPIPFDMKLLLDKLKDDNLSKGTQKDHWEGKLIQFISRFETKITDKTYGFMFQPNVCTEDYNWLGEMLCNLLGYNDFQKGIKIVDFSEVPSDVLPIVAGTLARLLYDIQFWMEVDKRTPLALICDEAHLYLPTKDVANVVQKQALDNFKRIAKEGRKYGVSLLPVSQRPSDVSKSILSQCSNFIVLRLTNERDKSTIRNLLPDSMKSTTDFLPLLDIGEALVVGDSILLPSKILLDRPKESHRPISVTKNFWDDWDQFKQDNDAIKKAVELLRKRSRI